MNSLFILFSVIRLAVSNFFVPNFLEEEIGAGNYKVIEVSSAAGADSYVILLLDKDTNKTLKFKVVSDDAGYIKILVSGINPEDISKRILNLTTGIEFSVIRTEENQGRKLVFAKY